MGAPQITADGDYSHEIKRCLILGRKAMTNLESIFKSRDITLPTKVHLVRSDQISHSVVSDSLRPHELLIVKVMVFSRSHVRMRELAHAKELLLSNCGVGEDS